MFKSLLITFLFILRFDLASAFDLKAGDVLLISFNCYECRVIESETNSKFSHSGIVIKNELNEIRIGQSLGSVALYPVEQFLKNRTPGTLVSVYRPKQFMAQSLSDQKSLEHRMLNIFNTNFKGAPFDSRYIWDNFDEQGRELLYCSEFIAKYIDHFLDSPTIPYPLTYNKNYDYWFKYFNGAIPEGVIGNSPASFSYDERFQFVGNL